MATSIKLLPRANSNLFSGKLTAALGASDTYFVGDTPPSADKLPIYLWIDYGASNQELVMAYDVSGNNIYIKRGLNTGGVGQSHNIDSQYREAITSFHFNKLADSIEDWWADEHTEVYTFTKLSDTQFKITGVDRTDVYTADTIIKFNGNVIATVSSSSYASGDTTVNVSGGVVPTTISSVEIFLNRAFAKEHNSDGTHKSALVTTLKATGSDVNTGTDDTKIVSPKAIADSYLYYQYNSIYRQAIMNGNFDIWQRGTSITNPAHGTYLADRWRIAYSITGTLPSNIIHSRQTLTTGDINGSFYFYRVNPDGAGSGYGADDFYQVRQAIEHGTRYLCGSGKKVTVSFWARSSISNKKIGVRLQQVYGSGGSPSLGEIIAGTNWTLTSTWTKYTYTFTTNTLSGKTFGTNNDDYLQLDFVMVWGTNTASYVGASGTETFGGSGNIDIAQVQLCAGDVALPFMPKSYNEELKACQRYFWNSRGNGSGAPLLTDWFVASSTTSSYSRVRHPVPMRTQPALIQSGTATNMRLYDYVSSVINITGISLTGAHITDNNGDVISSEVNATVSSGLTQYRMYALFHSGSSTSDYIGFSADL